MFCGTSSFKRLVDADDPGAPAVGTSPKGSGKKARGSKNPYSTRGLDKFSAVLSDLEARRQEVMARAGSRGVAAVKFMYESTNDWIPIVVRPRDRKDEEDRVSGPPPKPAPAPAAAPAGRGGAGEGAERKANEGLLGGGRRRESYGWVALGVVVVVGIWACMVVFGRVFAICCACICWYLVPSMKGEGGIKERRSVKGRENARRLSDKRLGANKVVVEASSLANKMNHNGRRA